MNIAALQRTASVEELKDAIDHLSYRNDVLNESGQILVEALRKLGDLSEENRQIVDRALSDAAEVC